MRFSGLLFAALSLLAACSGNEEPPPPPPTIVALAAVDSATDAPVADTHILIDDTTWTALSESGTLDVELTPGPHTYRIVAGGYVGLPRPLEFTPSFDLPANQTTSVRVALDPLGVVSNAGDITGTVTKDGAPLAGVLVVAVGTTRVTVTDSAGVYVLPGLAAGTYAVNARVGGASGQAKLGVDVTAGAATEGVDFALTTDVGVAVGGAITGGTGTSSVVLLDASSGHPVSGLSTVGALDGTYSISGVTAGDYVVVAAYERDAYVLDPETIRENGPIEITVADTDIVQDLLVAPVVDGLAPVGITDASPTLRWAPFAGADYYVVEVRDPSGRVIWAGFDSTGQWNERVIGATEVAYAGPALVPGPRYSFRVFAVLQNPVVASDFDLIAGSERLDGQFRIRR